MRHRDLALLVDVDQRLDEAHRRARLDRELGQRQRILGEARAAEAGAGIEEAAADARVEADAMGDVHHVAADFLA